MEKTQEIKAPKECCSTRDVLWYLVFTGFAVNYMIRINLNIAIVSMIAQRPKNNISLTGKSTAEQLYLENGTLTSNVYIVNSTNASFNGTMNVITRWNATTIDAGNWSDSATTPSVVENNVTEQPDSKPLFKFESRKFDWNEKQQGTILGSFFWLHWTTQIPGGLLASRYGAKLVFGLSNCMGILVCFLIPFCAYKGAGFLIFARVCQGLLTGFAWPAMHCMTARWIPPNERSKFVTAYLGSSVGASLTYPICGFIIDRWGWELVFYTCGVMGMLWFFAWGTLVYDSPNEHPRISEKEREYIVASLGQSVATAKETAPVPWLKIFTSVPVWMNILAQWGGIWGLFTLMTHAPTYFKFIHGWNIKATGLLSGMPHLLRMLWAWVFSQLGDYLLRSNKMTRSNVRKLATIACCFVQGVFMLALAYSGCDRNAAIVFLTLAVASHGAVSTGPLASIVDISPNYASVIFGCCNTIVAMVGFLTPIVVGHLTFQNQTVQQWQKVFWIAAVFLFTSGILYTIFSRSELQSWNSPEKQNGLPETELMVIKKKNQVEDNEKNGEYEKVPVAYSDLKEK
ncbi:sialin [Anoplophora glabripennis]|uniref:sialin n=1 Tax=Anoplophora glabripennis TaxID=217634 RepID=UPI000874650E|nr:sialin [Anoplophora glabripennis]